MQTDEGNLQQPTGEVESPISPASGNESQPLPEYVTALATRLNEQDKLIKSLQKGTDKQIGQVRSDVKRILELKEQGLNEDQIKRELWIDSQISGGDAPSETPVGKQEQRPSIDIESSLKDLQFEPNDIELAALKLIHKEPAVLIQEAA